MEHHHATVRQLMIDAVDQATYKGEVARIVLGKLAAKRACATRELTMRVMAEGMNTRSQATG